MENISKNSTVKSYANKTRQATHYQDDDILMGIKKEEKNISNFDHMPAILKAKGWKEGEIFLIDDDSQALIGLINFIRGIDSEGVRIGVLFRIEGHTTPFCIEKKVCDDESETIVVYHTDSVVMDIDQGEATRELVKLISKVAPIYSLGFEDRDKHILRDFKRQSDEASCATYSLFDIEEMIKDPHFHTFIAQNHKQTREDNIFDICSLPPVFMSTIQSINGNNDESGVIRNGLKHFITEMTENYNVPEQTKIKINGEITDLVTLIQEIEEEDIPNPVINIMNEINLEHYHKASNQYCEESLGVFSLDQNKLNNSKSALEDKIYDIARQQYENYDSDVSDSEESLSDYVQESKTSPTTSPKVSNVLNLVGVGLVLGLIIYKCLQKTKNELTQTNEQDANSVHEHDIDDSSEIDEDEFINSSFAMGSNTARILESRSQKSSVFGVRS